jgi:hypothetical protein
VEPTTSHLPNCSLRPHPFSGHHIMHRTEVISEATRGAETENTARETYVKQDMVEISLDLTGKVMQVMTA